MEVEDSMKEIFSINKHAASMLLISARVFKHTGNTKRSESALKCVCVCEAANLVCVYSICMPCNSSYFSVIADKPVIYHLR